MRKAGLPKRRENRSADLVRLDREGHGKPRAGLRPADHLDRSSKELGKFLDDRQSQPGPDGGMPPLPVDLKEWLENMGKRVGIDPDTGIFNLNPELLLIGQG